jgi:hypothetical protein
MLNNFLFDDTKIAQHKIDVKMRMNEMLIWKDDMTTRKHKSEIQKACFGFYLMPDILSLQMN